jgi:hypothetical protein
MTARDDVKLHPVLLMALLAIVVAVVPSVYAQDEPTPVPEPAQEEPSATPDEPTPAPEPVKEEPTAETEEAEPAVAAAPTAEPVEAAAAEPAVAAIPVIYRQKTLIKVDGKAQANGVVELVVQPQGGEATKVRVNVLAKTKPKKITEDLAKELDFAIDDRYKVNRSGDKKIVVKTKKKNPPIAITIKTQSLSGVSVMVSNG